MPVTTGVAIFFLIWWVVLFTVLPWGVRSQQEGDAIAPGTDPGAPASPNLKRKLVWTTLLSLVIFAAGYVVYAERLITFAGMAAPFHLGEHKSNQ
jgi:predicted secreted protein